MNALFPVEQLREFIAAAMRALGMPDADAAQVASP